MKAPRKPPVDAPPPVELLARIVAIVEEAHTQVVLSVNGIMLVTHRRIGREIVEEVQQGASRATHGDAVIAQVALTQRFGRGYSERNIKYFRSFYLAFSDRAPEIRQSIAESATDTGEAIGEYPAALARLSRMYTRTLATDASR